jgi:hypothetical protein
MRNRRPKKQLDERSGLILKVRYVTMTNQIEPVKLNFKLTIN